MSNTRKRLEDTARKYEDTYQSETLPDSWTGELWIVEFVGPRHDFEDKQINHVFFHGNHCEHAVHEFVDHLDERELSSPDRVNVQIVKPGFTYL